MKRKTISLLCTATIVSTVILPIQAANNPFLKKGSIGSKLLNGAKIVLGIAALANSGYTIKKYFNHNEKLSEKATIVGQHMLNNFLKVEIEKHKKDKGGALSKEEIENDQKEFSAFNIETRQRYGVDFGDLAADAYRKLPNPNPYKTSAILSIPTGLACLACIISGIKGLQEDYQKPQEIKNFVKVEKLP